MSHEQLAAKVAARYTLSFSDKPAMSQVKAGLLNLQREAQRNLASVESFRRELKEFVEDFEYDMERGLLSEEVQTKADPIIDMFKDILKSKITVDDFGDVRKGGKDLEKALVDDPVIERKLLYYARNFATLGEESDDDLHPLDWWSKNVEQISMLAKLYVEGTEDEELVKAMENLAKTIRTMFVVGGSIEGALEEVIKMADKAMKALKDIKETPQPGKLEPYFEQKPNSKTKKAPKGPKPPKRPKFKEIREQVFEALKKDGWTLKTNLLVPHATRPDGEIKLWFKAQAVYSSAGAGTSLKDSHSLMSDLREVADMGMDRFIEWLNKLPDQRRRFRP